MAAATVTRLEEFFRDRTDGELRSIIKYDQRSYDIVYLRDDVAKQYSAEEIEDAIKDSRMDSLSAPMYTEAFAEDHGELSCLVQCFENVVEMNFVVGDGVGAAIALDAEALEQAHGLVADAREIILREQ